jgi:hypothetical protein
MGGMRDLEGRLVTLIGGSGFFGSRLTQELLGRGARVRIGCRHVERAYAIKPLANLGQMQVVRLDMRVEQEVAAAVAGADAVVNLVGAFTGDLDAVQGSGAGRVAALARAAGVQAFVQISAIGADAGSPVAYARTKAAGEVAVAAAFPARRSCGLRSCLGLTMPFWGCLPKSSRSFRSCRCLRPMRACSPCSSMMRRARWRKSWRAGRPMRGARSNWPGPKW